MWALTNATPFSAAQTFLGDADGVDMHVLAVRGSFDIGADGTCAPAARQAPVAHAPLMHPPDRSAGMICDLDTDFMKPGTDILVAGDAIPPEGGAASRPFQIGVRVGPVRKLLDVHARRVWAEGGLGPALVAARAQSPAPVIWENAFGGADPSGSGGVSEDNPLGRGYARGPRGLAGWEAPRIFYPGETYAGWPDRPRPASLGPLPRHWPERRALAGTYDAAWQEERAPLWARDLDPRYFMAAPADQRAIPPLGGGERCDVLGMSRGGRLSFDVPRERVHARVRIGGRVEKLRLRIGTLCVFPNEARVEVSWIGQHRCQGEREKIAATLILLKRLVRAPAGPVGAGAG